jgi:hypothetical protein
MLNVTSRSVTFPAKIYRKIAADSEADGAIGRLLKLEESVVPQRRIPSPTLGGCSGF